MHLRCIRPRCVFSVGEFTWVQCRRSISNVFVNKSSGAVSFTNFGQVFSTFMRHGRRVTNCVVRPFKSSLSSPCNILNDSKTSTKYLSTSEKSFKTKARQPAYWKIDPKAMESEDWIHIRDTFKVCPWALSGVESCVTVVGQDFSVAFDMGYAHKDSVKCQHIFISHGHTDHVGGIVSHASKRGLYNMPPATYYMPSHLIDPVNEIAEQFSKMNGNAINMKLQKLDIGNEVFLPGGFKVKPFKTIHRVPSQGYIMYRIKKSLKEEFKGQPTKAIGSLLREGSDIHDIQEIPEVAYTGDTMFDVFKDSKNHPDLLKVKLLITESTYLDHENKGGVSTVQRARDRGHTHLQEIVDNAELFRDVQDVLLVHFSDKYSSRYIRQQVELLVPEDFRQKLHLGLALKNRFEVKKS